MGAWTGTPMKSLDELVELSTEPFPGGSNRMFFFQGSLSLSLSLLWGLRLIWKSDATEDTNAAKRHFVVVFFPQNLLAMIFHTTVKQEMDKVDIFGMC